MAIKFVDMTTATEAVTPAGEAGSDQRRAEAPRDEAAGGDTGPAGEEPAADAVAAPRATTRRRKAEARAALDPAALDRTAPEGETPSETGGPPDAPPASAALPGFEDRPKPKRRAARPYWGFG